MPRGGAAPSERGGGQAEVQYSFPKLSAAEIREILASPELDIKVTEEDLNNPAGHVVRTVYEQLIEVLLHQAPRDLAQPGLHAAGLLEHEELHQESVPNMAYIRLLHKLLSTAGVRELTLNDVIKPEKKRLLRNLSAIINFAKFYEDREPVYDRLTQKTQNLAMDKHALEEENERFVSQRDEAKRRRAAEEPEEQKLKDLNAEQQEVVQNLFNQQTKLHEECQALKSQLNRVKDDNLSSELALQDADKELRELTAQIAPDPRKIKSTLAALQKADTSEKAEIRALENQNAQYVKQRDAIERIEATIDEALAAQADCEAEHMKLKEVQRGLRERADQTSRYEGERAEQQRQIKGLTQRCEHVRGAIRRLAEQHEKKMSHANAEHADLQKQWEEVQHERSHESKQLDENDAVLRDLHDHLLRARMEHEADVASVQQHQQQLATQVRAYHHDLLSAMKTVSASQANLAVA